MAPVGFELAVRGLLPALPERTTKTPRAPRPTKRNSEPPFLDDPSGAESGSLARPLVLLLSPSLPTDPAAGPVADPVAGTVDCRRRQEAAPKAVADTVSGQFLAII